MTRTRPFSELAKRVKVDPVQRAEMDEQKRAMRVALALGKLREQRGATQRDIADALDVSQSNVSRIEHEDDVYLSTLRGYVEALGGKLEIRAVFPDEQVVLIEDTAAVESVNSQ